jgi:hypothetical protein
MPALEATYEHRLSDVPGVLSYRVFKPPKPGQNTAFDARILLRTNAGSHELLVQQFRSHLSREMASHVASAHKGSAPVLLLAPHIGSGVAGTLIEAGINYLDASGNCHIAVPPFYVHVEGKSARSPDVNAGIRGPGFQVLFVYLAEPALLDAPLRTVAERAGVSRQPALSMRRRLLADGYVLESPSHSQWHPRRREDALALWLHGYQTTVRASLLEGTFRTRDKTPAELEANIARTFKGDSDEIRWGGTAAGFRLTGTYRGERTVLHVKTSGSDVARRLGALSDPNGTLIISRAFGTINWGPEGDTVHPLLVYSEMLSEGSERAREAAQEVYERHLAPLWREQ